MEIASKFSRIKNKNTVIHPIQNKSWQAVVSHSAANLFHKELLSLRELHFNSTYCLWKDPLCTLDIVLPFFFTAKVPFTTRIIN